MIVCDRQNKDCMIHSCKDCPGIDALKTYLHQFFKEQFLDSNFYSDVEFSDEDVALCFQETEVSAVDNN